MPAGARSPCPAASTATCTCTGGWAGCRWRPWWRPDAGGGRLTVADLTAYAVVERPPLVCQHRGARIATNPPPSFGGGIVCAALAGLEPGAVTDDSPAAVERLAAALVAMTDGHPLGSATVALPPSASPPTSVRGTTHVSVLDAEGNVATMTTSNGSCSGVFVPGTGVQLNNVMG